MCITTTGKVITHSMRIKVLQTNKIRKANMDNKANLNNPNYKEIKSKK